MDPDIIKAAPEAIKVVGAVAAAIPGGDLIRRMFGASADLIGERLRDKLRDRLARREQEGIDKATKMLKDAEITPKEIPFKILCQVLDGMSMEEDDSLHDMWAALLANAVSGIQFRIRPSFISLLRDMAPDEAQLLHAIQSTTLLAKAYAQKLGVRLVGADLMIETHEQWQMVSIEAETILDKVRYCFPQLDDENEVDYATRFISCVQALVSSGLIEEFPFFQDESPPRGTMVRVLDYCLTERGITFLHACSAPTSKP